MYTFLSICIIIVSILLTIVVLIQNSKGGGLAANFASGNQTFGVRQTAEGLEKVTWGLAIVLLVFCIAATGFISRKATSSSSDIQQRIEQSIPQQGQPEFPSIPQGTQPEAAQPAE